MAMLITKDEARHYLTDYVRSITVPSKGRNMYVCPLCGSGTGKGKTGAFSIDGDGTRWTCYSGSGCNGKGGDVFDLIGEHEHIESYPDRVKWLENWRGVTIERDNARTAPAPKPKTTTTDYTDLYKWANQSIADTTYHRGISLETLNRFNVGYLGAWSHPKDQYNHKSPRLIIPTSNESYIARDTRENIPEDQKAYAKSKVGSVHIFNAQALQRSTVPVFVVEGEIDAMSIVDAGGEAVGLGSTTSINKFMRLIEEQAPAQPLIIALDNDDAGTKASVELCGRLTAQKVSFFTGDGFNPASGYKDANEALMKDRDGLQERISAIYDRISQGVRDAEEEERAAYLRTSTANYIDSFNRSVDDSVNDPMYASGFMQLDDMLDGGLYEGLYIFGAVSSCGKTAFAAQIADYLAKDGHDVLYFTLEISRKRLMARSISRHTLLYWMNEYGKDARELQNAKTGRGITDGKRYTGYTDPYGRVHEGYTANEIKGIKEATKAYAEYADRLYIYEKTGREPLNVDTIEQAVKDHIHFTGRKPIVFIDYLQILDVHDPRATDKQNTDYSINELARLVREYGLIIIAISSFNRESYRGNGQEVSMSAFKESGLIEYGADVLLGMQLTGTGTKDFDFDKAKDKDPRSIEIKVLKNRDGKTGEKTYFDYYPAFNLFENVDGANDWNTAY